MARTPEEWGALLGSTLAKMQASDARFMLPAMSPDCSRIITETIAVIVAEARLQGRDDALLDLQAPTIARRRLHA
ncbi:hypothetical protein OCK02_07050 [Rhizobium sp. TRM96647]|uniref:hypothetical protein n=1 Tax=unclassified Rhizobium TaxID=2613769 RepID=UPI0021E7750A|nr:MULTISPECIES: hypothetical protein [unclassified Rhizobium]MCV3735955.1 hypothetical protein [Rhizobium sp. TRM96647]MCV3758383.1 hypothetical protein [Rhizobium sp. TRM96650]